jgi:NADH-quinone oxidoreductase subunit E
MSTGRSTDNPTRYDEATAERLLADADAIIARYPKPRSALLPLLHLVQSEDGYVSPAGIGFCAAVLDLSKAEVSAVATFYSQYKRHPNGDYAVGVCTNTLCAVMGGDAIFEELSSHLGIDHDETTEDGSITLERLECNAACDYAPVMMVNWEFFDNQTPASAVETVDRLRAGEQVAPTRGASSVCSFKAMSRVLAGFSDGRAREGVGAGPATLAGLEVARQNGWSAPGATSPAPVGAPATATTAAAKSETAAKKRATAAKAETATAADKPATAAQDAAAAKPETAAKKPTTAKKPATARKPAAATKPTTAKES